MAYHLCPIRCTYISGPITEAYRIAPFHTPIRGAYSAPYQVGQIAGQFAFTVCAGISWGAVYFPFAEV